MEEHGVTSVFVLWLCCVCIIPMDCMSMERKGRVKGESLRGILSAFFFFCISFFVHSSGGGVCVEVGRGEAGRSERSKGESAHRS